LRDRVEDTATELLGALSDGPGVVDIVAGYCSRLPVAVISDILGVPDADRPRVWRFGELAAPSLDLGVSVAAVPARAEGHRRVQLLARRSSANAARASG